MSYLQEPQRAFVPFGNPFRMIIPKGSSYLPPKLLSLLSSFEKSIAMRIEKLKPANSEDVLTLSCMRAAVESLCGIHSDIKTLITALELPVNDWEDKWINVYLDNSVKLLDICIAFSSEISRLKQGNLYLHSALHNLGSSNALSPQFVRAHSSLDGWKQHISSKNPRLDKCFSIMDGLVQTLDLPKIKNSSEGKVLMRAMYGVRVVTLFICSMLGAAFSGSADSLIDLKVVESSYLWGKAFTNVQTFINTKIIEKCSSGGVLEVLKDVEAVDTLAKMYPISQGGGHPIEAKILQKYTSDLLGSVEKLGCGLDLLAKEVDGFFQVVLRGRDALLSTLRLGTTTKVSDRVPSNYPVGQILMK